MPTDSKTNYLHIGYLGGCYDLGSIDLFDFQRAGMAVNAFKLDDTKCMRKWVAH